MEAHYQKKDATEEIQERKRGLSARGGLKNKEILIPSHILLLYAYDVQTQVAGGPQIMTRSCLHGDRGVMEIQVSSDR